MKHRQQLPVRQTSGGILVPGAPPPPVVAMLCLFSYGGLEEKTLDSLIQELFTSGQNGIDLYLHRISDDALISRSRSRATAKFLETDAEVLMMVDHDIEWRPGDLAATVRKAVETQSVVGGMYSCRAFGKGMASRLASEAVHFVPGGEALHAAEYVATGFMAIPRAVLEKTIEVLGKDGVDPDLRVRPCIENVSSREKAASEFYDIFRTFTVPSTMEAGKQEFLSEDWAACHRFKAAGFRCFVYERPLLRHWGQHGYTVHDGAWRPEEKK